MIKSSEKNIDVSDKGKVYTDLESAKDFMAKFVAAAQPGAVFGDPIEAGDYTVITASEVSSGGGFGSGIMSGLKSKIFSDKKANESEIEDVLEGSGEKTSNYHSGGMGGGGGAMARPVATIIIGPEGVEIKPIFDVTKILVTFLTALAGIIVAVNKMSK